MNEEDDFCPGVFPTCAEEFWEALDEAMEHEPGLDVQEFASEPVIFIGLWTQTTI